MAEKTYTEQQNIKYKKKLNELLDILPDFCTQYFDSLEFNKQPRTKIAYAMDIKGFFEFLIECIPKFSSYAMKDFKPQDLEKIDGTDITRYLRHVKLYKKNGRDITNSESAAKRKLCALRRFYEYYCRYEIISLNPTIKVDMPKIHEKAIIRMEPNEVAEFLDNVESGNKLTKTQLQSHEKLKTRDLALLTLMLGTDKVKVQNALVGGGFGGKEDMTVQHLSALLTYVTKKPIKMKLSRAESLLVHPKRHPFYMDMTMGCDENGVIQGVKAIVKSDTGAFASLGGPVLERACTHAAGPYHYENFEIEGTAYYTNNPPAGAFRGFGVTQTCFATETLLNMMADKVGITPWEIHYRNAIRPGEVLPNGQIVDNSTGLVETLEAVKEEYDAALAAGKAVGLGCAMKNAGVGVGIPDTGRVKLIVEEDEKLHIFTGASCIGQGLGTVLVQMIVTNTDLYHDDIVYERSNTWISPDSGTTSGSRQTLVTGEACRRACEKFMEAKNSGKSMKDMIGETFYGEYLAKTHPLGADVPNPISHVAYGYATQVCILDPKTGKIEKMIAAHDVGKAVNPLSCEGQIEGGVVMSMGYALREQYPIDENCKPIDKYGSLGLFRSHEVPEIEAIVIDKPGLDVACGAIGIGEITSIPTAPAIADAYCRFDGERRYSLPLSNTPYERKK